MKTKTQIKNQLKTFEKKFGYKVTDTSQLSQDWFNLKLGVISSSNMFKVVAKTSSQTRSTYMSELIGQICTSLQKDFENKYVEWGQMHEDAARKSFEFETDLKIEDAFFTFKDSEFREGSSADGLVFKSKKLISGLELKCPYATENYIEFLTKDKLKPEYQWQVQHAMRVFECDHWFASQYDPRMNVKPNHTKVFEIDDDKQKTMADAIPEFIKDMDKKLKSIGVEFGYQWQKFTKE